MRSIWKGAISSLRRFKDDVREVNQGFECGIGLTDFQDLKDGDIMMAHLGIWSRKDAFAPMFDPLIAGLKRKGFCFATIPERP